MADFMGTENFTTTQQIVYATAFKNRYHDKTLITRLTNGEWKGKFKGHGTTLQVPCLPIFTTQRRVKGDKIEYANLETYNETFTINRERNCAFKIEDEDNEFSALNLEGPFLNEQARQMSEDVDIEFLGDAPFKCHASNCGSNAGFRSEGYNLGTATAPVHIYKNDTNKNADSAVTTNKLNATEFITSMVATLEEMPGGLDATPFVVIHTSVAHLLQNSDLSKAEWMGDGMSTIRKNVQFLGKIGGADIIVCNQLPMWVENASVGSLGTAAEKEYLCFFGDSSAITYADEVRKQEKMRNIDDYADYFRARLVYDWFVRYPERIGYGLCAIPSAA